MPLYSEDLYNQGSTDLSSSTAAELAFVPAQDVVATTVQDAILENDAELTVVEDKWTAAEGINYTTFFENALV